MHMVRQHYYLFTGHPNDEVQSSSFVYSSCGVLHPVTWTQLWTSVGAHGAGLKRPKLLTNFEPPRPSQLPSGPGSYYTLVAS